MTLAHANTRVSLIVIASIVALCGAASMSCRKSKSVPADPDTCDLNRRLYGVSGTTSTEITDRSIAGARLFRFHRNSEPAYSSVIGCRSSGDLLEPDEVYELLPHGGSATDLARLHTWSFSEGGLAKLEVVQTEGRFVELGGPREVFTPPTIRLGVVTFWRVDKYEQWGTEARFYRYVIDSLTGLGGQSRFFLGADWHDSHENRASIVSKLREPSSRAGVFGLLARAPRVDVAKELMAAIEEESAPDVRYVGLMGLRGEAGVDHADRIARLAANESRWIVRIGVVETLATIPTANAHQLGIAIVQRESESRPRRVMQAALKD